MVKLMVVGVAIGSVRDRSKRCCFWYRTKLRAKNDAFSGDIPSNRCLDVVNPWHAQNARLESDLGGAEENLPFLVSVKCSDRHKMWMLSCVFQNETEALKPTGVSTVRRCRLSAGERRGVSWRKAEVGKV